MPDERDAHHHGDQAEPGEQCCDSQCELQGAVRCRTHTEFGDQCVGGTAPCEVTSRSVEQIGPFETGPVPAVDRDLEGSGFDDLALVGLDHAVVRAVGIELLRLDRSGDAVRGERDVLCAGEGVIRDGRHLEHVLGGAVDQRIVGIQVAIDDREVPVVLQQ